MREIKFRGITNEFSSPRWVYGDLICDCTDEPRIMTDYHDCYDPVTWTVDPATVGQFTGLRDENGREIYDGDIIEVDGEFIAEVVYSGGAYELYTKKEPLGTLSDIAYEYSLSIFEDGVEKTFSVIGNIHDNPGLLEKRP